MESISGKLIKYCIIRKVEIYQGKLRSNRILMISPQVGKIKL